MTINFKKHIKDRYKGRGNSWVKVPVTSPAYQKIINILSNVNANSYLSHIEREGFAWVRFSKASGTKENPKCSFEIRYKGSKIDHPDSILELDDNIAKTLSLLGNTPLKLNLELAQSQKNVTTKKKEAINKKQNNKHLKEKEELDIKVKAIKQEALANPTTIELQKWMEFLKSEDLLDYSI